MTDHCYILVAKPGVPTELLYIACATIRHERWRYSYGAQITPRRIAWLPMPSDDAAIAVVRDQLAAAARIEALALEEAADELDREIARERLAALASAPVQLVQGDALKIRLAKIEG